ncbi:MAG: caspase family protein, partial [Bacteroidetes bacterium]|nr:caspase family protein [Bacteroidota bacterium]
ATIISAAAGTQFALERGDLKNGVFTYSILELFEKNKTITVSQLKKYVNQRVAEITKGAQQPTSRTETLQNDWRVW